MLHLADRMSSAATTVPAWRSGAVLLALAVAAILLAQLAVHRLLPAMLRQDHTALGSAIFAVIGTTYAVLLAFVATTAWERYSAAERLTRHEANALASIELISRGLPDAAGQPIRDRVRAYLANVVGAEWPAMVAGREPTGSEPLLRELSRSVTGVSPSDGKETVLLGLLVGAIDDVAADRRDRRLAGQGSVPAAVWVVLLSGGALMIGFSALLGGPSRGVHLAMTAVLAASGILVVLLILDLSSPLRGRTTIPPDAYQQLLSDRGGDG